jgi:hypothetical protein
MLPTLFSVVLLAGAVSMHESMTQEQAISVATQAASKQLNLPAEQFSVQQAQAVDWPNSSLGCPQPGMMYLQVITPGFKVLLKAGAEVYPVHVAGTRAVVCVRGVGDARGPKAQAAQEKVKLVKRARESLAALLKVDAAKIQVHAIRTGSFGDASGCVDGTSNDKTGGKRVELEYAGRRYEYSADADEVRECTE